MSLLKENNNLSYKQIEYLLWFGRYMTKKNLDEEYGDSLTAEGLMKFERDIEDYENSNWQGVSNAKLLSLKLGDQVMHSVGRKDWEEIKTIKHKYHSHRDPEDYCKINGMFWQYDDIIDIKQKEITTGEGLQAQLERTSKPYKKLTKEEMWKCWEEIQKGQEEEYKQRK